MRYNSNTQKIRTIRDTLKEIDFSYYGVDYDSNSETHENHDELCKDDYCRCSTMSPVINSIDYREISKYIIDNLAITNEKIQYCVERICSTLTIEDFECHVCGGYYGQEMDGITIENYKILDKLEESIDIIVSRKNKLKKLNDVSVSDDKIRNILIMEYGYLLVDLKISTFSIIEIDTNDIIFPQEEHSKNLNDDKVKSYKNHSGICGIVKEKNGKYKVIDGYHRITANLNKPIIKVILST